MIIREFYETREDGVNLYRSYSDAEKLIRKIGTDEVYAEAIDVENSDFAYEETDEMIDGDEELSDAEFRAIVEGAL